MNSTLTPRRAQFVAEYLVDGNGTQAAIRAGYSHRCASVTATRLLANDKVAEAVAAGRQTILRDVEITAERVIAELGRIGFARMADFYRRDCGGRLVLDSEAIVDPKRSAAISHLEVHMASDGSQTLKIRLADKKGALQELAKYLDLANIRSAAQPDNVDSRTLALAVCALLREVAD